MDLPHDGQEYAHITFTDLPPGAVVEASLDRTNWHATSPGTNDLERLILLRGPDSGTSEGLIVNTSGVLSIRVIDMPEHVIREAGYIQLA